jgi:hypothetical protein
MISFLKTFPKLNTENNSWSAPINGIVLKEEYIWTTEFLDFDLLSRCPSSLHLKTKTDRFRNVVCFLEYQTMDKV